MRFFDRAWMPSGRPIGSRPLVGHLAQNECHLAECDANWLSMSNLWLIWSFGWVNLVFGPDQHSCWPKRALQVHRVKAPGPTSSASHVVGRSCACYLSLHARPLKHTRKRALFAHAGPAMQACCVLRRASMSAEWPKALCGCSGSAQARPG